MFFKLVHGCPSLILWVLYYEVAAYQLTLYQHDSEMGPSRVAKSILNVGLPQVVEQKIMLYNLTSGWTGLSISGNRIAAEQKQQMLLLLLQEAGVSLQQLYCVRLSAG
eukprot:23840-Chlamydomonas_euryale.AAC.5